MGCAATVRVGSQAFDFLSSSFAAKEVKTYPSFEARFFIFKMRKNNYLALIIIAGLILIGGGLAFTTLGGRADSGQILPAQTAQVKNLKASLLISSDGQTKTFSDLEIEDGRTALDLTKKMVSVITSGEGSNAFVTAINNRLADNNKKEFWELLVNGQSSQVGAGSYILKMGDKIEWKISTY